jgi:hypothetical protein
MLYWFERKRKPWSPASNKLPDLPTVRIGNVFSRNKITTLLRFKKLTKEELFEMEGFSKTSWDQLVVWCEGHGLPVPPSWKEAKKKA